MESKNIKSGRKGLRTWIEISKNAVRKNYETFRGIIGEKCLLMAIVKSNAYGHNLTKFSLLMQKFGADWFGIDSIVEALALRKAGVKKPILVLGYILPENFPQAADKNISITISSFENLKELQKFARKTKKGVNVHIKIDSGMRRQGFYPDQLAKVAKIIKTCPEIKLEGIYTHFAAAKNPALPKDTLNQIKEFEKAVQATKSLGFNPIIHAAATSGSILFPQSHYDMVRIGIGLYGLWPSKETKSAFENKIALSPALIWKTIISETKNAKRGDGIGYDFTEKLKRDSKIAVCPVGYWHGYDRKLSGKGNVIVKEKIVKILGRISMDMIVIDITDVKNAEVGDEVMLIGKENKKEIPADELARLVDTSNYEIITRINPLIKRFYI